MTDTPKTLLEAVRYFSSLKVCFETMLVVKWPEGNPACPKCGGHGFKIIRGTTTVGDQRCQPCDATGKVPLERLFRVEQRELVRWLISKMELEAGLAAPSAMKALASSLDLD